jgi:hypothetical protein
MIGHQGKQVSDQYNLNPQALALHPERDERSGHFTYWLPRAERKRIQQPRHRLEHVGELIQIDGSEHRWFEDRAPPCTLLVFIDDATSRLMEIRFVASESTFAYFETLKIYLQQHGRPVARQLVVNYNRMKFMLRPDKTPAAVAGKPVDIYDFPDGRLEIRWKGLPLPYSVFDHLQRVSHAAIIENTLVSC